MKRISLFLSVPQEKAVHDQARHLGLKVSEVIRRAIDEYLKQQGWVLKHEAEEARADLDTYLALGAPAREACWGGERARCQHAPHN